MNTLNVLLLSTRTTIDGRWSNTQFLLKAGGEKEPPRMSPYFEFLGVLFNGVIKMRGYKKCFDETKTKFVLVELEIEFGTIWFNPPWEVQFVFPNREKKCRAEKAKVVKIHGGGKFAFSLTDREFKYEAGITVEPSEAFDRNAQICCSSGIHFFLNKETAINYLNDTVVSWEENGEYEHLPIEKAIIDEENA